MADKAHNAKSPEEVPEVQAFEAVKERLRAFREANPQFFEFLDPMMEAYNDAHEAAEKAVRAQQISCGDFRLYQFQTKFNPDKLYDALGNDTFLAVGGKNSTVVVRSLDKARIESALKSGAISEEVAEQFVTKSPRFKKPEKANIP